MSGRGKENNGNRNGNVNESYSKLCEKCLKKCGKNTKNCLNGTCASLCGLFTRKNNRQGANANTNTEPPTRRRRAASLIGSLTDEELRMTPDELFQRYGVTFTTEVLFQERATRLHRASEAAGRSGAEKAYPPPPAAAAASGAEWPGPGYSRAAGAPPYNGSSSSSSSSASFRSPGFGVPGFGSSGFGSRFGAPGFGAPGFGAPGYRPSGVPGFGAPGSGAWSSRPSAPRGFAASARFTRGAPGIRQRWQPARYPVYGTENGGTSGAANSGNESTSSANANANAAAKAAKQEAANRRSQAAAAARFAEINEEAQERIRASMPANIDYDAMTCEEALSLAGQQLRDVTKHQRIRDELGDPPMLRSKKHFRLWAAAVGHTDQGGIKEFFQKVNGCFTKEKNEEEWQENTTWQKGGKRKTKKQNNKKRSLKRR